MVLVLVIGARYVVLVLAPVIGAWRALVFIMVLFIRFYHDMLAHY